MCERVRRVHLVYRDSMRHCTARSAVRHVAYVSDCDCAPRHTHVGARCQVGRRLQYTCIARPLKAGRLYGKRRCNISSACSVHGSFNALAQVGDINYNVSGGTPPHPKRCRCGRQKAHLGPANGAPSKGVLNSPGRSKCH